MTEENHVVEVHPDVTAEKTASWFRRHRTKIYGTALTLGAAAVFVAGRRSKDVVDSVDLDVNYTDTNDSDN